MKNKGPTVDYDIVGSLYIMGGLFAMGMTLSVVIDGVASNYHFQMASDNWDRAVIIFFAIVIFLSLSVVNLLFSWIAAGFWLHRVIQNLGR